MEKINWLCRAVSYLPLGRSGESGEQFQKSDSGTRPPKTQELEAAGTSEGREPGMPWNKKIHPETTYRAVRTPFSLPIKLYHMAPTLHASRVQKLISEETEPGRVGTQGHQVL